MDLREFDDKEIIDIIKKHKITYKYKLSGINIPFGCEIEFEDVNYKKVEKKLNFLKEKNKNLLSWKLVEEDSLNPFFYSEIFSNNLNGGEIVSPILNDREKDWKALEDVCTFLRRMNARTLYLSAAHIHFDNKDFKDYERLKKVLSLWALYEDIIFRFSAGFKDEIRSCVKTYAIPVSNRIVASLYKTNNYEDLKKSLNTPRTNAFSIYNFDKKINDSFEVRCPNGTLSEKIWQNNINFFKHLLEASLNDLKDWDFIDYKLKKYIPCNYNLDLYNFLNIKKASELAEFIFDEDEEKKSFMKQYIKR